MKFRPHEFRQLQRTSDVQVPCLAPPLLLINSQEFLTVDNLPPFHPRESSFRAVRRLHVEGGPE